jgi:hypothetical protein
LKLRLQAAPPLVVAKILAGVPESVAKQVDELGQLIPLKLVALLRGVDALHARPSVVLVNVPSEKTARHVVVLAQLTATSEPTLVLFCTLHVAPASVVAMIWLPARQQFVPATKQTLVLGQLMARRLLPLDRRGSQLSPLFVVPSTVPPGLNALTAKHVLVEGQVIPVTDCVVPDGARKRQVVPPLVVPMICA